MDKPLDIRIVQLVDALNQIGIDPTSVKQLIEELLSGVDEEVDETETGWREGDKVWWDTGMERIEGEIVYIYKLSLPNLVVVSTEKGGVAINTDKLNRQTTHEEVHSQNDLTDEKMQHYIEKILTDEKMQHYLEKTLGLHETGETVKPHLVSPPPCKSDSPIGDTFKVGDKVWWDIGLLTGMNNHVKQGTIHSLETPDPSKVFVKVEGDDPPHWVSVDKLNKTEVTPLPGAMQRWSGPNQTGNLFKQGDKVWFFDVYSGRVHGTIYRFSDGKGGRLDIWGGRAEIKVTKTVGTPLSVSADILSGDDCLYPNLADLQIDNGDIVDEAGGITGLRLKLGQSVKSKASRDIEGILIGFQKTGDTIIFGVVWSEGRILSFIYLHQLEVVPELSRLEDSDDDSEWDTGELDEEPCDFLEEAKGVEDEQFYLGNRVWFWDPIGKRIIRGNIHRLDTNLPGESVLVQQFEGLHPRWVSCQVEELHRDTGRITTENILPLPGKVEEWCSDPFLVGEWCWWFTESDWANSSFDRQSGTLVGFLTYEGNPDAIIVEDDRQHPEWPVDEYKLHFVDARRLGYY